MISSFRNVWTEGYHQWFNRTILQYYTDAAAISSYTGDAVAAISGRRVVVNYRDIHVLNPIQNVTHPEVAALIYQTLVDAERVRAIALSYIVDINEDEL